MLNYILELAIQRNLTDPPKYIIAICKSGSQKFYLRYCLVGNNLPDFLQYENSNQLIYIFDKSAVPINVKRFINNNQVQENDEISQEIKSFESVLGEISFKFAQYFPERLIRGVNVIRLDHAQRDKELLPSSSNRKRIRNEPNIEPTRNLDKYYYDLDKRFYDSFNGSFASLLQYLRKDIKEQGHAQWFRADFRCSPIDLRSDFLKLSQNVFRDSFIDDEDYNEMPPGKKSYRPSSFQMKECSSTIRRLQPMVKIPILVTIVRSQICHVLMSLTKTGGTCNLRLSRRS